MRPRQLEVVHGRPPARRMTGIVSPSLSIHSVLQVGCRDELAKRLRRCCSIKGRVDLPSDVEDRPDASVPQPVPIPCIILGTQPYSRQYLNWAVDIRCGRRVVFVFAEKTTGNAGARK